MKRSLMGLLAFCVIVSTVGAHADDSDTTLKVGTYTGSGKVSGIAITQWANRFLLKGKVHYAGTQNLTVNVSRDTVDPTKYVGQGSFRQTWTDGSVCDYEVRMNLFPMGEKLFMELWRPTTIWTSLSVGQSCFPVPDGYAWETIQEPYVLTPIP